MILRKSPSSFLRALRSVPADTLPALKVKKLSRRQMIAMGIILVALALLNM